MKSINFITTNACNANCSFCFEKLKQNFKPIKISREVIDSTIEYFFKLWGNTNEVISLDLFGGEPTLAEDECIYIVEKALELAPKYNVHFKILLFTNAFVYPEKLIQKIKDTNTLMTMQISNEGVDNFLKDHNNIKLRDTIHTNILKYIETGIPFSVRATMSSQNLTTSDNLLNSVKLMVELGVKSFYFFPIMEHGWNESHFKIWKDGFHLIAEYLFEKYKNDVNFDFSLNNFFHEVTEEISPLCGAGLDYVSIDTDGKVYSCQRLLPITQENSESLGNVFDGVALKQLGNLDAHESCRSCKVKNCKVCPVVSYTDNSLSVGKTDYCKIREILWDEYMYFNDLMKTIGMYNIPTEEEMEQLKTIINLELEIFMLFNQRNIDIESGFNLYNTRLTYKQNIIRTLSRILEIFVSITGDISIVNMSVTSEDDILTGLVQKIEYILHAIYDDNEYIFYDVDTSILIIASLATIMLEEKYGNI